MWLLDVAAGVAGEHPEGNQNLLELAHRHGLLGLLADVDSSAYWPAVVPLYSRLVARQGVMLRNLSRLTSALYEAGIPATVLKGPWLSSMVYDNPRHRNYSDLDLLVPRDSLTAALEVIGRHPGVRSIPRQKPEADKREIPVFDQSGVTFAIDLHWDLFSYGQLRGRADQATDEAWKNASLNHASPLGPVWELPPAAMMAFLAAHATLDHRFRLILFRDLLELTSRPTDWAAVLDFTGSHSLRSTTYLALWLSRRWVNAPIPEAVLEEMRPSSLPLAASERLAARIDPITFDGHRPHPLNLAMVLLHDQRRDRMSLVARAPTALPGWWRKVRSTPHGLGLPLATIVVVGTRRRGAEVFGEQLGAGLFRSGWQSDLVALVRTPGGPEVSAVALTDDRSYLPRLDFRIVRRLRQRITDTRPAVVLANGSATLKYTALALIGLRNRPKFLYASVGEPNYWTKGRLRGLAQRLLLSRADRVLAVSEETARQLIDDFGLRRDKVVVAETGVPAEFLQLEATGDADTLRVLVLGSLSEEKDPGAAVEVVHRLATTHRATLRMVGSGPLSEQVARQAEAAGIDLELTGPVEDVAPSLNWADVLLLTSKTEGLPGAVLEAGAAGVPTVGFGVGGVGEAIVDGETGIVVAAGDVDEAAAALRTLATDRALRVRLGEAARRHVAERYLLSHAIERYRQVIESVVGGSGDPGPVNGGTGSS